jgi:hypothetical protein
MPRSELKGDGTCCYKAARNNAKVDHARPLSKAALAAPVGFEADRTLKSDTPAPRSGLEPARADGGNKMPNPPPEGKFSATLSLC